MIFSYQVDDGYTEAARWLRVEIDDADLIEAETLSEAVELAKDEIQEHFNRNVSPGYNGPKLEAQIKELRRAK